MVVAGLVFALTSWVPLLILAGAIGVISPTGNEVGPFLAVEQAALTQTVPDRRRTATFAWYNLVGYVATATGALGAGPAQPGAARRRASRRLDAYRAIVIGYARHRRCVMVGRLLAARAGDRGAAARGRDRRHPAAARARALASGSSSSCRSCSRSTPSAAGSSRRA